MSAPGWYPDPSHPGSGLRYWDGGAWSQQTTAGAAPPPSKRPWLWFVIAMGVIAVVVAVFILRPGGLTTTAEDTNSARPTGSQWNEVPPTETPSPPEETGSGETIDCPQNSFDDRSEVSSDGRMHGGGLSFEAPKGWEARPVYMPWMYDHNSTIRPITSSWMSNLSAGEVLRSEGFTDPRSTATQLMGCLASSGLYMGFTGREDLTDASFRLDGHGGWRITADVHVENQGSIKGDVVDVIVVDLGDADKFAVFISCATIDDEKNLAEVARATDSLRVD
ncbi:DUF2510 domain-containing protein [Tessaracoccus antarcticus]|uniref:DUF2510 domain-containing protein n=1 Tax=Tessaracoccus antarcticus TaxID=2479848 RepID=A0A3M0G3Q9_9ACTN|nr:DUF2510 domain-containing protein [Tessaracoccus antarcticus]RMB59591.1 DUF2510 domain-containing protein [Tessaracoccus antarcticus]